MINLVFSPKIFGIFRNSIFVWTLNIIGWTNQRLFRYLNDQPFKMAQQNWIVNISIYTNITDNLCRQHIITMNIYIYLGAFRRNLCSVQMNLLLTQRLQKHDTYKQILWLNLKCWSVHSSSIKFVTNWKSCVLI